MLFSFPYYHPLLLVTVQPMDGYPHQSAALHPLSRKRKADVDDCQVADRSSSPDAPRTESLLLDSAATPRIQSTVLEHPPSTPRLIFSHTPALSWSLNSSHSAKFSFLSNSCQDGPSKPKRPRIEIPEETPSASRKGRRWRAPNTAVSPSPRRSASLTPQLEIRDSGFLSASSSCCPSPTRTTDSSRPSPAPHASRSVPITPIEPNSLHVPPHLPPINRETLKELDLEAMTRNPQLRHDLLFDVGLQFRPTASRRKRAAADHYWIAILRELESGCTCTSIDKRGRLSERGTTSRLKPMLRELLEVLVSIINPLLPEIAGPSSQPGTHSQYQHNSQHVAYLRSILDEDLIQQMLDHGLFDPSGVFQAIGDIMRCYCAPMRDQAVEQMITLAKSCSPEGSGTKVDAVRALRLCFEIMELMKLDVANHQLQGLRHTLTSSAAQFELKMFQENREKGTLSLDSTRQSLQASHQELLAQKAGSTAGSVLVQQQPRYTRVQLSVIRTIVGLIFDSPPPPPSPVSSPTATPVMRKAPSNLPTNFPETLYLDYARITTLATDCADYTALYMMLMLYRQLVHSGQQNSSQHAVKLEDLVALKKEIWEIGPTHMGQCFVAPNFKDEAEREASMARWRQETSDAVLQLTMRADEARSKLPSRMTEESEPSPSTSQSLPGFQTPDPKLLQLATNWADSHLRQDSPISSLMRSRVRRAVEEAVIEMMIPTLGPKKSVSQDTLAGELPATGLEPLTSEIRHISERLVKLINIHMNVYGILYTQPGFIMD